MFLASRRIETYAWWKNFNVKIWPKVRSRGKGQVVKLSFLFETEEVGQLDVHNTLITARYGGQHCSSCCDTSNQMLTYDLKWPWSGHKSKLVIFWPRRTWDIILKVIAQSVIAVAQIMAGVVKISPRCFIGEFMTLFLTLGHQIRKS